MKEDLERVIGRNISGPFSLNYNDDKLYLSFYFASTSKESKIELNTTA